MSVLFVITVIGIMVLIYFCICRIVRKLFMNGLESVEVVKGLDMSAIIIKGGKRLSANAYLALELVIFCRTGNLITMKFQFDKVSEA